MAVRKLPNRKKFASKGKVIRISDKVFNCLSLRRRNRSWDSFFRGELGLEGRHGKYNKALVEGILELLSGKFIFKHGKTWEALEKDAYEIAFIYAAKLKTKNIPKPLCFRELP